MAASALIEKGRIEALSDGVYAVALTLLVLDLKLPPLAGGLNQALAAVLIDKGLVWLLSFWVGALFWLAQNRGLRHYAQLDRPALLLELAQLALISLLPFSTALIAEHGVQVAAALVYSLHLALLAILALLRVVRLQRVPALRLALSDEDALGAQIRRARVVVACTLAAVALAFVVPGWNMLALLGMLLWRPLARAGTPHR